MQTLVSRDRRERSSRNRYPLLRREARANPNDLMGFALAPEFAAQLAALRIEEAPSGLKVAVLDTPGTPLLASADLRVDIPEAVSIWADEIDLNGLIPLREARTGLEMLVSDIPRWTAHG